MRSQQKVSRLTGPDGAASGAKRRCSAPAPEKHSTVSFSAVACGLPGKSRKYASHLTGQWKPAPALLQWLAD